MKNLYIAYGSNMDKEQMKFRCPNAKFRGAGYLDGQRLEFYLHATIEPCEKGRVPVAVWEVTESDVKNLDIYEGYPRYYKTADFSVKLNDGNTLKGFAYVMNKIRVSPPDYDYFERIAESYISLGFGGELKELNGALKRAYTRQK